MNRGYSYGKASLTKLGTGEPIIRALAYEAMKIANTRKLFCPDFGISEVLRTQSQQFEHYKKGRVQSAEGWVKVGPVVTNCGGYEKKSVHQSGLALDFYPLDENGKADYSEEACMRVATCFMEAALNLGVRIDWGGSFRSISDLPHIEVIL